MSKIKKTICILLTTMLFVGAVVLLCSCTPDIDVHVDGVYAVLDTSSNTATVYGFDKHYSVGAFEPQDCYVPDTIYYDGESYTVTELSNFWGYANEFVVNGHVKKLVIPQTVRLINLFSFRLSDTFDYLEEIIVHRDNEYYASSDGVLYTKDYSAIVMYPPAKRDTTMLIKREVTEIYNNQLNFSNRYVEKVIVEAGNTVYSEKDGVLYSKMGAPEYEPYAYSTLEYVPYAYGNALELPDGVYSIARWSLRYANIEHLYIPASVINIVFSREVAYNPLRYVSNVYFEQEEPIYPQLFGDYLMNVHCGVSREEFKEMISADKE